MKRPIAILGIVSVTFGTACDFATTAIYQLGPSLFGDMGAFYNVAVGTNVLGSLAWWIGVVMIGVAAMTSDQRPNPYPKP